MSRLNGHTFLGGKEKVFPRTQCLVVIEIVPFRKCLQNNKFQVEE